MQTEAREVSTYLGQELTGPLAVDVECAGEGSKDGATRGHVVEQREGLRAAALDRALQIHPDRQA